MASGEFSADGVDGLLAPAAAVRAPEQRPPATEAEPKARRRPSPSEPASDDLLTPTEERPPHRVDDLA